MNNAFVVDADSHILEPIDLWENYLEDKSLLPLAPRFFNDENGDQHAGEGNDGTDRQVDAARDDDESHADSGDP